MTQKNDQPLHEFLKALCAVVLVTCLALTSTPAKGQDEDEAPPPTVVEQAYAMAWRLSSGLTRPLRNEFADLLDIVKRERPTDASQFHKALILKVQEKVDALEESSIARDYWTALGESLRTTPLVPATGEYQKRWRLVYWTWWHLSDKDRKELHEKIVKLAKEHEGDYASFWDKLRLLIDSKLGYEDLIDPNGSAQQAGLIPQPPERRRRADDQRQADDRGGPDDESSYRAPAGSGLVLTGTVVADRPAFLSVVGPTGATLSGVVVEVDGERRVTDERGRIVIPAVSAVAGGTMWARLTTADGAVRSAQATVVPPSSAGLTGPSSSAPPTVTDVPSYPTRDAPVTIRGEGFGGDFETLGVRLGAEPAAVLSASPTELVAQMPAEAPLGTQALTVTTATGDSAPAIVTLVALRLTSEDTTLTRGRKGQATIHVDGTRRSLRLEVASLSPDVIALAGGQTQVVTTSGGDDNRAKIKYRGLSPGTFQITATVLDERGEKP